MPGPPTINWYRADLRSPLPGGLSRPADHLYQSLLFFFPSPFLILLSEVGSGGRCAEWTAGKMLKPGQRGGKLTASFVGRHRDVVHEYSGTRVVVRLIYVLSIGIRWRMNVWVLVQSFLCRPLSLTSSFFRSRSPSPGFVHLVGLLSNISLFSSFLFFSLSLSCYSGLGQTTLCLFHALIDWAIWTVIIISAADIYKSISFLKPPTFPLCCVFYAAWLPFQWSGWPIMVNLRYNQGNFTM